MQVNSVVELNPIRLEFSNYIVINTSIHLIPHDSPSDCGWGWLIGCASVTVNWRAISIRLISIGKCCVIDKKLEFGNVQFNWRIYLLEV